MLAVNVSGGKVTGVKTATGAIQAPTVVDAAGAWTRQVAEASGIRVPLNSYSSAADRHGARGRRARRPMVRIMDAAVYLPPALPGRLPLGRL